MKIISKLFINTTIIVTMLCLSGCALLIVHGVETLKNRQDVKETMDMSCSFSSPAQQVWAAAVETADKLKLEVSAKNYSNENGMIEARNPNLSYIRIYISRSEPGHTVVGVQARKTMVPSSTDGYDYSFSELIINKIREAVGESIK
jgi:hypothetical protein